MKRLLYLFVLVFIVSSCECSRSSNEANSNNARLESITTDYQELMETHNGDSWKDRMETEEYNKSLERELQLKKAGMDNAAKMERNARNQYLRNGGYDSKDGGKQVHYKGSKQQEDDLKAIDEYMRTHPDF